jgi:hypothetical protein
LPALDAASRAAQAAAMIQTLTATPMRLLRNADVYAPEALGRRHLLLGGGKVLWMGEVRCRPIAGRARFDAIDLDLAVAPGPRLHRRPRARHRRRRRGRLRQPRAGADCCRATPRAA